MKELFLRGARLAALACTIGGAGAALADPSYHLANTVKIGGEGSWDYAAFDSSSGRLFLTRVGGVQVIDAKTGATLGSVPATAGTRIHGIALAGDLGLGFTGEGNDRSVALFDLKTLAPKQRVSIGRAVDAVAYDPASHRAFAFAGDEGIAFAIDPASGKMLGEIALGGSAEAAAADGAGRLFVNLSDKAEIAVIDTAKLQVVAHWPLGKGCEDPTPLAYDHAHGRLFSGCRSGIAVVMDAQSGKALATVPIGKGADSAVFDTDAGLAFIACNDGSIAVIKADGKSAAVVQTVKTQPGGRIVALDQATHRLFVPVADLGPALPKTEDTPSRPAIIPETFRVLTIEP